jgi:mono/diheme cytochrome c family protein
VICWLAGDLLPALWATKYPGWAASLTWLGPAVVGLALAAFVAPNPQRLAKVWLPIEALVRQPGIVATAIVGTALSIRTGLVAYSLPYAKHGTRQRTELQHFPAPAEFLQQKNPFDEPQFCVVLEQVGEEPDAVRDIIRAAVANRSSQHAADLVRQSPIVIREAADRVSADALVAKLRAVGATATVRDAIDWFVESIAIDRATPIGQPDQVLDDEFLQTGHDAIAEIRNAVADSGATPLDRALAARAHRAFVTAQGRALYQVNCRPCHGTKGSGDGPMAARFSLRPANFRDPQGIRMLQPGEMLWRIEEGSAALPPEGTPWDSSMPAWRHDLDRESIWKIILAEFNTANVQPATEGTPHRHHQTKTLAGNLKVMEQSWLNWPVPPEPPREKFIDPDFVRAGGYLYYYRCMTCHGVTGRGDGPAAFTMLPRPRDFTAENFQIPTPQPKFKFRTTTQGWLPLHQDLYRTISRGLTGTAMEGWHDVLAPDEIWQIIAYIKTLSPAWNDPEHIARNPYDPVVVQEFAELDRSSPIVNYGAMQPPHRTATLSEEGRNVFVRFRCYECHGFDARGDGGALGQHYDDWGYRMWPQNLAKPFNYKAGHAVKEIYRTFANRLDGTVMPVYSAKTLDSADPAHGEQLQWALATYVSGQVESNATAKPSWTIVADRLEGDLPADPADVAWNGIPEHVVPLAGQVLVAPRWTAPSVNQVAMRVAINSSSIAIRLRWDDRRPNIDHEEPSTNFMPQAVESSYGSYAAPALEPKAPVVFNARDQLEIQFPRSPTGQPFRPPFFYGSEEAPVLLWRWAADRQQLQITKRVEEIAGALAERLECMTDSAAEPANAVELITARGPSIAEQHNGPPIRSRADWSNGEWTLVLTGSGESIVEPLLRGGSTPIAVHIWDGLAGESGLRMAISSWIDVVLKRPRPMWQHWLAAVLALLVFIALSAGRRARRID